MGSHQVPLLYLYWEWEATRYYYLTSTDSGEPSGTTTLPLLTMGSHQVPLSYLYWLYITLPLLIVWSHQVPLPYLYWQSGATRYLYLSSTDWWELPGTSTLPLLTIGSYQAGTLPLLTVGRHPVPSPYLYWQWEATRYLYLTSTNSVEPPGTTTLPLLTMGSHQVLLPYLYWQWGASGTSTLPY